MKWPFLENMKKKKRKRKSNTERTPFSLLANIDFIYKNSIVKKQQILKEYKKKKRK